MERGTIMALGDKGRHDRPRSFRPRMGSNFNFGEKVDTVLQHDKVGH